MSNKKEKIEWYIKSDDPLWGKTLLVTYRSRWLRISEVTAKEILKTHKYIAQVWPDNDCFHYPHEFDVIIKKVTKTIEFL